MNSIERKSLELIRHAISMKATDIHLIPKKSQALIRYRINQQLHNVGELPKPKLEKMISHFKFNADMDIGERRRPQSGAMEILVDGTLYSLRISTLPTSFQESLAIRILPQLQSFSLHTLALFPHSARKLLSLINLASGLIVITGPTGSGKTTTLHAMLQMMKERYVRNIISIEDPIEMKSDDMLQMEINEKANLTYEEGLKAILRHDPDVIMIGEIRDEITAKLAVRAALTGHLVLTTVHAKDSIGAIYRLLDFDISKIELGQTVTAVISQRLVNTLCIYCGDQCHPLCQKVSDTRSYAIYEILAGEALSTHLKMDYQNKNQPVPLYSLKSGFKKAVALGFISPKVYQMWIGELE